MKSVKLIILAAWALLAFQTGMQAQEIALDSLGYSNEYLDTVNVRKKFSINDYVLVGVQYGASRNSMTFNPVYRQKAFYCPDYFGVSFIKYGKMFGYMPYFGLKLGFMYGHEGYEFKADKETGAISSIEGYTKAVYDIVEMPLLAHIHVDLSHFKVLAEVGPYAGYRLNIHRSGPVGNPSVDVAESFLDTDKRLDYGLQGGGGIGLVFDPVELHINATLRYSWATIYAPDYASKEYYRYAYPFDVMLTAGLYFQLTKRTGSTNKVLKQRAREYVNNPVNYKK